MIFDQRRRELARRVFGDVVVTDGILGGLGLSWLSRFVLKQWNGTHISSERDYVMLAIVGGLLCSLLGALYPAWRAAGLDAVEALSYE